ncbi:FecR family protein [Flavobacterium wongokense]|uniref:FecR family protein n=1 Tax=Flavobacterium wongokense TaxID=2910674 RepID=UPI001F26A50E|nr:FecR family protein [Flavobacterium sp. WG47]MCF6132642.1 FecR domain-containing protein [Flavobacterium sp. WG47]
MTIMENENETYLSDWLAGKISDGQLKQLVGESDFLDYQKLKNTLEGYTTANPDMEQNFSAIKQKIETQKSKKTARVFPLWRYAAIAAAVLLFFGLFQLFYFSNTNETGFGATQMVTLPDNSQVTLNAKSKLSYPNLFQYNRTLDLEGEAFFEVQKGSRFTVKTALGCVTVLGTKFNVNSHKDYFEVICYEGKVRVETKGKIAILTPSESIRFYDHTSENWADMQTKPSWINGETTFKNVPMQYVLSQFTNQYNVVIDYPKSVENVKFTGAFTHKNRAVALKSICIPLHLKYSDNGAGKIIISE